MILGLPRVERKFGVEYTTFYRELFEEKLQTVTSIDIVDKEYAFAFDEFQSKHHIGQ